MRGELKTNHKSNITISVGDKVFEEIKKDAEGRGLSINAHVNDILQRHTVFYRHVSEQGGVIIPQKFYAEVVNLIDEDKLMYLLDEMGGKEVITSIFAHNGIPFTIDNLVKYCFESISLWAGTYSSFRYRRDESNKTELVFEHKFGIKWSKAIGYAFSRFIQNTTGCSATFKALPTTTIVKVDCS